MEISDMTSLNVKEAKTGHNVDIPQRSGAASLQGAARSEDHLASAAAGGGFHPPQDDDVGFTTVRYDRRPRSEQANVEGRSLALTSRRGGDLGSLPLAVAIERMAVAHETNIEPHEVGAGAVSSATAAAPAAAAAAAAHAPATAAELARQAATAARAAAVSAREAAAKARAE